MTSRLADRPMSTLKEVIAEVSWCWKTITKKDISEAFAKMRERMQEAIGFEGNISVYLSCCVLLNKCLTRIPNFVS